MERETFVFHKEWREATSGLPAEVRLEIYEAIIEYGISGRLTDLKPMAALAFRFVKATLDRDAERYGKAVERSRTNGKSGGRPAAETQSAESQTQQNPVGFSETHSNPKNPVGFSETQQNPTKPQKPSGPYNDNDYDNDIEEKKERKKESAAGAATLQKRKEDFYSSLVPYVTTYGKDLIRQFFDYWTEPNRSATRMRYELERTWDLRRRLATWARRDKNFQSHDQDHHQPAQQPTADRRRAGAIGLIARLAAEDDGHRDV